MGTLLQVAFISLSSRWLRPADVGVFVLAAAILRFVSFFAGLNMSTALVKVPLIRPGTVLSALATAVVFGIALTALGIASAPVVAWAMHDHALSREVGILSWTMAMNSLAEVPVGMLRRNLRFGALSICETSSYATGYAGVGLLLAASGWGAESLAVGAVTAAGVRTGLTWMIARPRLGGRPRWATARELARFGVGLSGLNLLEFLLSTTDTLLVGRLLGSRSLGVYSRAQSLLQSPAYQGSVVFSRVTGAVLARSSEERVGWILPRVLAATTFLLSTLGLWVVLCSKSFVGVLYGSRWYEVAPLMPAMAVAVTANLSSSTVAATLEHRGHLRVRYAAAAAQALILLVLMAAAVRRGTLFGYATAWALSESARFGISVAAGVAAFKCRLSEFTALGRMVLLALTVEAMTGLSVRWAVRLLTDGPAAEVAAVGAGIAAAFVASSVLRDSPVRRLWVELGIAEALPSGWARRILLGRTCSAALPPEVR